MILLFTPATFIEATTFLLALIALLLAVRFFQNSRRRLQEMFPDITKSRRLLPFTVDRNGFLLPNKSYKNAKAEIKPVGKPVAIAQPDATKEELKLLRSQLQQQQQQLEKALAQFQAMSHKKESALAHATETLRPQMSEAWEEKSGDENSDAQQLKQQTAYSQTLVDRLADAETEISRLRATVQEMEGQAWQAAELSIQLERAETEQAHLEQTLLEKEEKMRELMIENNRLRDALGGLQHELSEAASHRQQLLKKTHFLEAVNADLQQVSDTNKKLKKEATRVAELESMIELMSGERTVWQKRW